MIIFLRFSGQKLNANDLRVVGGNLNRFWSNASTYIGTVSRTVIHESYNMNTLHYDIGLITVRANEIKWSSTVLNWIFHSFSSPLPFLPQTPSSNRLLWQLWPLQQTPLVSFPAGDTWALKELLLLLLSSKLPMFSSTIARGVAPPTLVPFHQILSARESMAVESTPVKATLEVLYSVTESWLEWFPPALNAHVLIFQASIPMFLRFAAGY